MDVAAQRLVCVLCNRYTWCSSSVALGTIRAGPLLKWADELRRLAGNRGVVCLNCIQIPIKKNCRNLVVTPNLKKYKDIPDPVYCTRCKKFFTGHVGHLCSGVSKTPKPEPTEDIPLANRMKVKSPTSQEVKMSCRFCKLTIKMSSYLGPHFKRKRCKNCQKRFMCVALLLRHARSCFKEEKPDARSTRAHSAGEVVDIKIERKSTTMESAHACPTCPEQFASASDLVRHQTRAVLCYKCQVRLRCHTLLQRHIDDGHADNKEDIVPEEDLDSDSGFECDHCEAYFSQQDALEAHKQEEECDLCDKKFVCKGLLSKHKVSSKVNCKHCRMGLHGKEELQMHREQNTCRRCGRVFMCKTLALRHITDLKCYPKKYKISEESDKKADRKCDSCGKQLKSSVELAIHLSNDLCSCGVRFKCESKLKAHRSKTEHAPVNTTNAVETRSGANAQHKCSKCARSFASYVALRLHLSTAQNCKNGSKVTCSSCGANFNNIYKMRRHQSDSTCQKCGDDLGCSKFVAAHANHCGQKTSAKQERSKMCKFCQGLYRSRQHHLGSRFTCNPCQLDFLCYGLLKQHESKDCPVWQSKLSCEHCKGVLGCQQSLKKHSIPRFCHKCHWRAPCVSLLNAHNCKNVQKVPPVARTVWDTPPPPADTPYTQQQPFNPPPPEQILQKCPYCAIPCESAEVLKRHALPSNCPRCSFMQPCSTMLARHLDDCRFNLSSVGHQCPLCAKFFSNAALLGTHVQVCGATGLLRDRANYMCDECGRLYNSASKVRRHKERKHTPKVSETWSNHEEEPVEDEALDLSASPFKSEPREEIIPVFAEGAASCETSVIVKNEINC